MGKKEPRLQKARARDEISKFYRVHHFPPYRRVWSII
jgi:hypothetical protein